MTYILQCVDEPQLTSCLSLTAVSSSESLPKASPGTTAPDGNPQVCRASEQHDICSLRPAFHYQRDNPGISLWYGIFIDCREDC